MKRRMLGLVGAVSAIVLVAASPVPASSDSVWVQEYQRPTQDSRCTAPADETPWQSTYSGQRDWTPSWSTWPNGGRGGWVCSRTFVWARATSPAPQVSSPAPWATAGCTLFNLAGQYVDYLGGWSLAAGSTIYSVANCVVSAGTTGENGVFAANASEADDKCEAIWPGTRSFNPGGLVGGNYQCVVPPG